MKHKSVSVIKLLKDKYPQYTEKELYAFIMCKEVKCGKETISNKATKLPPSSELTINKKKWVSRGGIKLEHAFKEWKINCNGKNVLDAGSSTGGFTDVALRHGASLVYAVDVGYNQLDYSLRKDPRVHVMERTNIISVNGLQPTPHFAVADLSFRSIRGAASHILKQTIENCLLALVKPQFEIDITDEFDGIIRDKALLFDVLLKLAKSLELERVKIEKIITSPIKGGKGNTEFLCKLSLDNKKEVLNNELIIRKFMKEA